MLVAAIRTEKLSFVVDTDKEGRARLIHFSSKPFDSTGYEEKDYSDYHTLVELHMLGFETNENHASRHTKLSPAWELRYVSHDLQEIEGGKVLKVYLKEKHVAVCMTYEFYDNTSVVRAFAEVRNISECVLTLDYISSFHYAGIAKNEKNWATNTFLYIPHNSWQGELQWKKNSISDLGLAKFDVATLKKLSWHQTGTWSSSEYIPMAVLECPNEKLSYCWQIENNGSWYTEIGHACATEGLYLQLCGPQYAHNHFLKDLAPGESFETVPVACGVCDGGFNEAIRDITQYRRNIRRKHSDNEELSVIYNDYMNCLFAQPNEEKELPLIDAAAEVGAEYFIIDAGWFAEAEGPKASWWNSIGVWKESPSRFPSGLNTLMDYIRSKGMKPGLWIEIEGIGPDCEIVDTMPDDWFFQVRGKRTTERYRYQLDFSNPQVRAFATEAVEDIIQKYDIKYLKIDYNRNAGLGTDCNAESLGSGLLRHCRGYLEWLDELMGRHPDLVIENCASGGMRTDYAMLSRCSIHSTSDQTHYDLYSSISAMAGSAVTPEQAAIWSYPLESGDEEEAVFNMVNAMLARIHQSGFINRISKESFARVKEGIACYKSIRQDIKTAFPIFPLGIIGFGSPWSVTALDCGTHWYLAVCRKDGEKETLEIPIEVPRAKRVKVECIYPSGMPVAFQFMEEKQVLAVTLREQYRARLFRIIFE